MSPALMTVIESAEQFAEQLESADDHDFPLRGRIKEIRQAVSIIRGEQGTPSLKTSIGVITTEIVNRCDHADGAEIDIGHTTDRNCAHKILMTARSKGLECRTQRIDDSVHIFVRMVR